MPRSRKRVHSLDEGCAEVAFAVLGPIANNVYFIGDGEDDGLIIVDPGFFPDEIMSVAGDRRVDAILVTHNHWDHVNALAEVKRRTGAPVIAPAIDAPVIEAGQEDSGIVTEGCAIDRKVGDGDTISVGKTEWKVIATPGHTPGSVCYFLDSDKAPRPKGHSLLASGDTLFCGSIGRTDFEGGSMRDMRKSLKRLSQLPDSTIVLPGHNSLTTIQVEQNRVFAYYA